MELLILCGPRNGYPPAAKVNLTKTDRSIQFVCDSLPADQLPLHPCAALLFSTRRYAKQNQSPVPLCPMMSKDWSVLKGEIDAVIESFGSLVEVAPRTDRSGKKAAKANPS